MYPRLPIPTELSFEPINLCNAKCYCCPYSWLGESKEYRSQKMSREQIVFLINDFANLLKKYNVTPWSAHIQPWRYSDPLVCPDLETIFELADKNKMQVIITTNGISFTEKNCKIINQYKHLIKKLNISIIGFNTKEIKKFMGVNWEVTKQRLLKVKKNYPDISKLMRIGIKEGNDKFINEATRKQLHREFKKYTLGIIKIKTNWLNNRMASGDGVWIKSKEYSINKENFVQGCTLDLGKILRRIEILVDGTVVLCCDDATKQTNYGNVFELGIEKAWQNLQNVHNLIYNKNYSSAKQNLICNTCSRARFKWNDTQKTETEDSLRSVATKSNLVLI